MVFLVGAQRSGTNWLQRILGAHPDIATVPSETHVFSHGLAPLADRVHHGAASSPTTSLVFMEHERFVRSLRAFCDDLFTGLLDVIAPSARLLVERTPLHVHHLELIAAVYPDAYVLHIVRDGRDVARSLVAHEWGPDSIADGARTWASAVRDARRAAPAVPRYREVRYEELLADPVRGITEIYTWLGVDTAAAVVDVALTEAGVRFNHDPSDPTIEAGKWRRSLSTADLSAFDAVAGDLLAELGYDASDVPARARRTAPATRARDALDGVRRRGRSLRRRSARPAAGERDAVEDIRWAQLTVDRFLSALHAEDYEAVAAMFGPGAAVRCVAGGDDWSGRDTDAVARLVAVLRADAPRRGRQLRGDVHPGFPLTTVLAYDDGAGNRSHAVFVTTVADEAISRIVYYRV